MNLEIARLVFVLLTYCRLPLPPLVAAPYAVYTLRMEICGRQFAPSAPGLSARRITSRQIMPGIKTPIAEFNDPNKQPACRLSASRKTAYSLLGRLEG